MGILGSLGRGKTLALTYLCWNNYFLKKRKIYANYTLYGIPFRYVDSIEALESIIPLDNRFEDIFKNEEYVLAGDELWRWVSSQCIGRGSRFKRELINKILLASRKAFITIIYTSQTSRQIDSWIRETTDIWVYPILSGDILTLYFCDRAINSPTYYDLVKYSVDKPIRVWATPFYAMYNTYERVLVLKESGSVGSEVVYDISKNPAWYKYIVIDNKHSEEEFKKMCDYIRKKFWLLGGDDGEKVSADNKLGEPKELEGN
ncbi:MAG: hypothetical protein QXL14_02105 [Candidatus Aenigmatarchaeota archaeon]